MGDRPDGLLVAAYSGGRLTGDLGAPPVPWWSITKTCLAACALVLVERGKLALDEPLLERSFTLRQLLQHTSGLGSYTARPEYLAAVEANEEPWSDAELLSRVRLDPFLFKPGAGWSYSNTGYFLVRLLIEQTAGADIDTALRTLVLAPLGIEHTRIARERADLDICAWRNARLYHPGWVFHGLLIGPPADAALFMHRLLQGELLPPPLRDAMLARRALDVPLEKGRPWRTAGYGLGLMMDIDSPCGMSIGHSGQGPGSVSAAYCIPDLDPPRAIAAFAPVEDQGVVERAVIDTAQAYGW